MLKQSLLALSVFGAFAGVAQAEALKVGLLPPYLHLLVIWVRMHAMLFTGFKTKRG